MYGTMKEYLQKSIDTIRSDGLYKEERIITSPQNALIDVRGGQKVLNMCANNYLGLSSHPEIVAAAKSSYENWGYGLSSVRFIS
jgi:glycine C-acetyltransferase